MVIENKLIEARERTVNWAKGEDVIFPDEKLWQEKINKLYRVERFCYWCEKKFRISHPSQNYCSAECRLSRQKIMAKFANWHRVK